MPENNRRIICVFFFLLFFLSCSLSWISDLHALDQVEDGGQEVGGGEEDGCFDVGNIDIQTAKN